MNNIFYLFLINCAFISAWDLSNLNINGNYYTSSITVFKGRTFLALPRSSCYNKLSYPTLVEVMWTGETRTPFTRKKTFPNNREQIWHECKYLQDVISLDIESNKGRLWVLDKGNEICNPKIVIYNLYFNNLIHSHELTNILRRDLTTLVIDPIINQHDTRAYIGASRENTLLVFSFNKLNSWIIKLKSATNSNLITTKYLTISKLTPTLYFTTDNNKGLFSVDLKDLRNFKAPTVANDTIKVNATFLGQKLGRSSGLVTDLKGGLIYYMIRDYAVMRWDTSKPLNADYHNLLAQSYEALPYVSCLFSGPYNGIWALVNPYRPQWCTDHNRTLSTIGDSRGVNSRIIKLLKYNDIIKYKR